MVTPQITLRVDPAVLEVWKERCERENTTVSQKIRELMTEWATSAPWPPELTTK